MVARYGDIDVFVTNAHCTFDFGLNQITFFDQPLNPYYIGKEIHDVPFTYSDSLNYYVRYSDAALVRFDILNFKFGTVAFTNGRGLEWGEFSQYQIEIVHANELPGPRLTYVDEQISLINLPVVKVGQETGSTVGYVDNTCVTIKSGPNFLLCQDIAGPLYSKHGDSGAPVFTDYTSDIEEGEAKLLGIVHGIVEDEYGNLTEQTAYSPLSGIREDLELGNLNLTFVPINTRILGNSPIENTGTYTYQTEVENETGSVNYQWSIKWEGNATWNTLGNNSMQIVNVINSKNYTLKIEVTDDISTTSALFPVINNVVDEDCLPTEPCEN